MIFYLGILHTAAEERALMSDEQYLESIKRAAIIGAARAIVNTPMEKLNPWL